MRQITNLVIGGGGIPGIAIAGVIDKLTQEHPNFLANIKRVHGVSVGAIAALLIALNFSAKDVIEMFSSINFKNLKDGAWGTQWYRLFNYFGIYKGDALETLIEDFLSIKIKKDLDSFPLELKETIAKKPIKEITFADLKACGYKDLYVTVTEIYTLGGIQKTEKKCFSFENTPHTSVLLPLRASATAPTIFSPIYLKQSEKGEYVRDNTGHVFTDGGVADNFEINFFDGLPPYSLSKKMSQKKNYATLGICLPLDNSEVSKQATNCKQPIASLSHYAEAMTNCLLHRAEKQKIIDNEDRIIKIDRGDVNSTEFDITADKKNKLIQAGRDAAEKYLNTASTQKMTKRSLSHGALSSLIKK